MTKKLEELRRMISDERVAHVVESEDLDPIVSCIEQCIALSKQPPVYAMSEEQMTALVKRLYPISKDLMGRDYEAQHMRRVAAMRALIEANITVAPSPQAVTVEGLEHLVNDWFHNTPRNKDLWEALRTRLDQYLNNR